MNHCKTIAIVNQKGGVGKTTSTVNLGVGLAQAGNRVLLVDDDPQHSLTISLGIRNADENLDTTLATAMQAEIRDESVPWEEGIIHSDEGVDLLPANIELSGVEMSLFNAMSREQVLKSVLSRVKENYDYILIDCMPSLGLMSVNALVAADSVIIPSAPDFLSTKGLNLLIRTISRVRRQINPKLKIDGILMTMVDGRTNNAKSCYDGVELYRRADFQYADPRGVREDGRPGRAGDDGAVTKNRSISLDNFVRFVYNGNTPKGGLTYVHYRNRTKTEPREISSAGSHPGHLYHPQRENHCQAGISLPGPRGHR